MAWRTVGYKQINTQGGSATVFALATQADYSINAAAGTATVSGRLLMMSTWSVPYHGWSHSVVFRINNVQKYSGALNEPNTSGDWSSSAYNQTINGKAYNNGCLIGSWSQTVSLTASPQSIPVYGSYSVAGTATYLPVKGTHVASGNIIIPAAGYPSGSISVTSNTRTSATLTGSVSSWGTNSAAGSSVISYGTSTSYGSTATSGTAFTVSPNTTYYYRFRITNAAGLVTDYTENFTTPGNVPSITNTSVGSITRTGGTISYNVTYDTNASYSSREIQYGLTTSYGTSTTNNVLSSLTPNTLYYYRIRVTDNWSRVSSWAAGSFTTPGNAPSITSTSVGSITRTGGTISYNITYDTNASYSSREIQYGLTTSYGTNTTNNVLTGLNPNTLYYYRIRVTDNWSRVSGWSTGSFTTSGNTPTISSTSVTNITAKEATIEWVDSYDTNAHAWLTEVQYGLTISYGESKGDGFLVDLTPASLYYYRIRVQDNWGRYSSWSTGTFTTLADSFVRLIYSNGTVTDTKKIYLIDENGVKTEITKQMFHIIT